MTLYQYDSNRIFNVAIVVIVSWKGLMVFFSIMTMVWKNGKQAIFLKRFKNSFKNFVLVFPIRHNFI